MFLLTDLPWYSNGGIRSGQNPRDIKRESGDQFCTVLLFGGAYIENLITSSVC